MVPVADAHAHTNPARGLGASKVAARFRASGGWFMALVALSPWAYSIEFNGLDSYRDMIDILISECKAAHDEGLKIACIAGFHPADIDRLVDKYGMSLREVYELGVKVLEYEATLCSEGILDGIGEVGRQHYKTSPIRGVVAQYLLEKALQLAKDYSCILHMHLEQSGEDTVWLVEEAAKRAGFTEPSPRVIFHHSKPNLAIRVTERGYSATIPGTPMLLNNVFGKIPPLYMLESDYIDDPRRPGAVVYPWVMAETVNRLVEKGRVDSEYTYKVNVDNIEKVYGVFYE